jgi:hypothetical protein
MALPRAVIDEDARFEQASNSASEALAKHRWHWTLDKKNDQRVSIREYAKAVNRNFRTIHAYVNGYVMFSDAGASITLAEGIERARVGTEKEAAIEAVAVAKGISFGQARKHSDEVKRVQQIAQGRAVSKGTTYEEEVVNTAKWAERSHIVSKDLKAKRTGRVDARFIEMEGMLAPVKRKLLDALNLAREVDFDPEHIELLQISLGNVKALIGLIDMALAGAVEVDWDAELASLTKESK